MDPSEFHVGDNPSEKQKRKRQLQISPPPPPPPLRVPNSHKIKKHPKPPSFPLRLRRRSIHTTASDFKNVVQCLTGNSSVDLPGSSCGDLSPAARLALTENAIPRGGKKLAAIDELVSTKTELAEFGGYAPGILTPSPAMLPAASSSMFSHCFDLAPPNFSDFWDSKINSSGEISLGDDKLTKSTGETCVTDSGTTSTNFAGKSISTAPKMQTDEWQSFCKFLIDRQRPLTLSGCRTNDVIDFLCLPQTSSDVEGLAGRLGAACEVFGIKPKDNPFHRVGVAAYLKTGKKMTREAECVLVFSCNDHLDVEIASFIEAISKELHKREVTPLAYSLSGKEHLDMDMLCRSNVGILVLDVYGWSGQSLDHFISIMEHSKAKNRAIIPVYFKVTLSDIRRLEGNFTEGILLNLVSAQPGRVYKWKATMAELESINGHEWTKETQGMLTEEVVRSACLRLNLKRSENLVRILALLNHSQPSAADIVGIWGMAGIGKTSIAREIFGTIAPRYDLCYFVQDFDLMCHTKGLRQMRDDFYSKVFGEEKPSISASDVKLSFMRDWFHTKSILVVLDDVGNARDAEAVVGGFGWFSHRHRIIFTSRRKQVLVQCNVKDLYEIEKLSDFESFCLCKQYLSEESVFISELINCGSGIPLALNALGSSLSKPHINNMMSHFHSLQIDPPTQIQEAFRRSFDGLDENEKNIFLDLACFFRGDHRDHVVQLLDACGFRTYLGICDLIDESLISLVDDRIEIPIPFQHIARFIVRVEDEDPSERSRLWDSHDITDVLTNNSGTEAIEGIFLDTSGLTCELGPTVFGEMYRLRLLKFYCSTSGSQGKLSLPQGLETLPEELRLLHWENYPLGYLPERFNPENLTEVNMPYSYIEKLWEGKKNLKKLKKINLSHSRKLKDILILSEALNLEQIDLEGCTSLIDVSTSIPLCGKLISLNMKNCSHLRNLPTMVDLTSLKLLHLSGCSELEEIQDLAPNLKELCLAGTAIRELPFAIDNLGELVLLDLENCKRLERLPLGISNSSTTEKRADAMIYVGDLSPDVTDTFLQEFFVSRYPSVKSAKVVIDSITGRSKGYGFVMFGDTNERSRALVEMNGAFCSNKSMRVGAAALQRPMANRRQHSSQALLVASGHGVDGMAHGSKSDAESNNSTIFVGDLDRVVTDEDLRQLFSQFGEVVSVKIPVGRRCAFVQFDNRKSAEDAMENLNGTIIGENSIRLSRGRNPNKLVNFFFGVDASIQYL